MVSGSLYPTSFIRAAKAVSYETWKGSFVRLSVRPSVIPQREGHVLYFAHFCTWFSKQWKIGRKFDQMAPWCLSGKISKSDRRTDVRSGRWMDDLWVDKLSAERTVGDLFARLRFTMPVIRCYWYATGTLATGILAAGTLATDSLVSQQLPII